MSAGGGAALELSRVVDADECDDAVDLEVDVEVVVEVVVARAVVVEEGAVVTRWGGAGDSV